VPTYGGRKINGSKGEESFNPAAKPGGNPLLIPLSYPNGGKKRGERDRGVEPTPLSRGNTSKGEEWLGGRRHETVPYIIRLPAGRKKECEEWWTLSAQTGRKRGVKGKKRKEKRSSTDTPAVEAFLRNYRDDDSKGTYSGNSTNHRMRALAERRGKKHGEKEKRKKEGAFERSCFTMPFNTVSGDDVEKEFRKEGEE